MGDFDDFQVEGDGYLIRMAEDADIEQVDHVFADTWRYAYTGILPEGFFKFTTVEALKAKRNGEMRFQPLVAGSVLTRLVLEIEGQIKGVAFGFLTCEKEGYKELCDDQPFLLSLYAHPSVMGRGYGKAMIHAFALYMQQKGASFFTLSVLRDNDKARAFYEKMGGKCLEQTGFWKCEAGEFPEVYYRFEIEKVLK